MFKKQDHDDTVAMIITGSAAVAAFGLGWFFTKDAVIAVQTAEAVVKNYHGITKEQVSLWGHLKKRYHYHYNQNKLKTTKNVILVNDKILKIDAHYVAFASLKSAVLSGDVDVTMIIFYKETEESPLEKHYLTFNTNKEAAAYGDSWMLKRRILGL
jgi:hypothetical protein